MSRLAVQRDLFPIQHSPQSMAQAFATLPLRPGNQLFSFVRTGSRSAMAFLHRIGHVSNAAGKQQYRRIELALPAPSPSRLPP
jgi:hypothetical protein